jgi:nickel/cobalt transporter (NicO) family protein
MRRRIAMGLLVPIVAAFALLAGAPRTAAAHPLGEATISQYSAISVGDGRVEVRYVVDMAEIPAFQELGTIRADRSTELSEQERATYLERKGDELLKNIALSLDDKELELERGETTFSFPPGNGGLPTLRFEMSLSADLDGRESGTLRYRDGNFEGRKGWREVIANPLPGTAITASDVPTDDQTDALTLYQLDVTSNPPDKRDATVSFAPGESVSGVAAGSTQPGEPRAKEWADGRGDFFSNLLRDREIPLVFALLLAFVAGAGHALSPGHGKTVVAAYLVGTRGTAGHAAILGLTVTISHTIGVFALGIIVLVFGQYILPETVVPFLGFVSGLLISLVGVVLFVQRLRHWRAARNGSQDHGHDHGHDHPHSHDHDHEHEHDASVPHKHGPFGKEHTHLPSDGRAVTVGSLLALGITGGIIPCPSALVVLLVAIYTNQVGLGLMLIVSFSLGLASVLTVLGLAVVYGKGLLSRVKLGGRLRSGALLGRLPMASALAVTCLGFVIAFSALAAR